MHVFTQHDKFSTIHFFFLLYKCTVEYIILLNPPDSLFGVCLGTNTKLRDREKLYLSTSPSMVIRSARTFWLPTWLPAGCRCLTKGQAGLTLLYMSGSESLGGVTLKSFLKRTKRFGCTQLSIRLAASKPSHPRPSFPAATATHAFTLRWKHSL